MFRYAFSTALVIGWLVACGGSSQAPPGSPAEENPPSGGLRSATAGDLIRELDVWDAEVEVSERNEPGIGLGDTVVRVEGEAVWPPAGEACLGLVQCCEQLITLDPAFSMLCQFSIAKNGNCGNGLATMQTILTEQQRELPAACAR